MDWPSPEIREASHRFYDAHPPSPDGWLHTVGIGVDPTTNREAIVLYVSDEQAARRVVPTGEFEGHPVVVKVSGPFYLCVSNP